jgi:hypothetical protein
MAYAPSYILSLKAFSASSAFYAPDMQDAL